MKFLKEICRILPFLALPAVLAAATEIKVIASAADLPEPISSLWQKGDMVISDGKTIALIGGVPRPLGTRTLNAPISNAMGSILSFVPAGKKISSDLLIGSPALRIKNRTYYPIYSSVKPIKQNAEITALECTAVYDGKDGTKAEVRTVYHFLLQEQKIEIASALTNVGKTAFSDLSFTLYFHAYSSYSFNPYHKEKFPDLNFRVYQKQGHFLGWINQNPVEEEDEKGEKKNLPGALAPGKSYELRYVLLVNTAGDSLLQSIYKHLGKDAFPATISFADFGGKLAEVIVREAVTSATFFRAFLEKPLLVDIIVPPGTYNVRANIFPAVAEKYLEIRNEDDIEKNICAIQSPPLGSLKIKLQNSHGEYVPGKVTFIGLEPTKTPYFEPENPTKTGKSYEAFKNSCYPLEGGTELQVAAGTYLVYASRGPEYTMTTRVIEVLKDQKQELVFVIDKVIERPDLVSLDPHLHTQNSDGSVLVPARLRSLVAEGVEVAVATDHNHITDYSSALSKLRLDRYLAVLSGSEVTTPDNRIHYNTYPEEYRPAEVNNGAISPLAETIDALFQASRKNSPQAILQVNHPRAGTLGYFNNYYLDKESAATAQEGMDLSFDTLEVMNGPFFFPSNSAAIEDWFHLLNRGYFYPIIGSSDTHAIDRAEPGYSRTYIFYGGKRGNDLNWPLVAEALKKGRSFATNGPLVDFKVNGKYAPGDTFSAPGGKVDIGIQVRSAPWVAVDEVRLIINGERKVIFPVSAPEKSLEKFAEELTLTLKKDAYLAVEALGKRTLFPVLQQFARSGELKDAAFPYALTNPVFVDVDGNGKFNPPLPQPVQFIQEPLEANSRTPRR
jgi:hypothetical protein